MTETQGPPLRSGRGAAAVAVLTLCAAALWAWHLGRLPVEPYYGAAARAMSRSGHAFWFAAADAQSTVSIDKLPGGIWPQALAVSAFGVHAWSLALPSAIAFVLAVPATYRLVARLGGTAAGVAAAAVLTFSPAVVALERGNIPDGLLILLLVLAANDVVAARDRPVRLVAAGLWLGLAFEVKMLAAWLVLPALLAGLVVLAWRAGRVRAMLGWAAAGLATMVVVALAWPVLVDLVPAASRPWVDGTTDDSVLTQTFGYNGFARLGSDTPNAILQREGLPIVIDAGRPSPLRLFTGPLGLDIGWLLPLALVSLVAGLARRAGRAQVAGYALFGTWLVVVGGAFSVMQEMNPYYVAMLAPAIAGAVGLGVGELLSAPTPRAVAVAAVAVAGTVGYGLALASGRWTPWPFYAAAAIGAAVALAALLWSLRSARRIGVAVAAATACALVPAAAAAATVAERAGGAVDVPFESQATQRQHALWFHDTLASSARLIPVLQRVRAGSPYLLTTGSGAVASVFALSTDDEVYAIGGFDGHGARPTVGEIRSGVAAGRIRLVVASAATDDPRIAWIAHACQRRGGDASSGTATYICTPASARGGEQRR
ncbi:glycosyltransferase family 39 protein [Tsukamurella sp. 8F]|uniref:glycosyltransferase family 39 protein n=1 Tax=unclassified Tsukamurella TaxID=2633480 RepID=UPI0023B98BDD|nr:MULTISPECIES: glycosyltransferase family 39 protein [unclassified Tsukamurella]MDF0528409.1 glycosyltransferase family 39 protein [Tsukamurella sp. 8J]MDF0586234.1 glycosyltransferase family 39 protein [Tsukamurella sp. 8F]